MQYAVPSSTILNALSERNITAIDSSDGIVVFKRNCSLMGQLDAIEEAFLKKFQKEAPHVVIESKPSINAKTNLPADFKRYQLSDIQISETMLKKNSGTFIATFHITNKEKKLYFTYEMDAKVMVFKAKRNLHNGKILMNDDYESVWVSLETLPPRALLNIIPPHSSIKASIKEGQVLMEYHLEVKKTLSKKALIKARLKDEGLVIEVQASLLEDANVGDIVKIKTEQGKILNAKIVSTNEAMIVE